MKHENYSLLDYLLNHSEYDKSRVDLLRYELDQRVYYYGQQFKNPLEGRTKRKSSVIHQVKSIVKKVLSIYLKKTRVTNGKRIVSNSYFSVNSELSKLGFDVYQPIHSGFLSADKLEDFGLSREYKKVNNFIENGTFSELLSKEFSQLLDNYRVYLLKYYSDNKVSALIVPNDIAFFELLNIQIFKELKRPSFIFLHGLPGRYNIYDDNQTDYIIVWGDKIKEHYVNVGFKPEKIIVSGHPYYKNTPPMVLRNNLENIVVLTKSMPGNQWRDEVRMADRGNLISYLYSIENVLKSIGVKKVLLRVHPSENIEWYYQFVDRSFFKPDKLDLKTTLCNATIIIGPTSSVFLESIYYGVNYLVYEPSFNNIDFFNYELVPPFDGSNKKVPVAKDEDTLKQMIVEKVLVDSSVFFEYVNPKFDMSFMKNILN